MSKLKPILRNAGWNFAGMLAPVLAALVCVPFLVAQMGVVRFGLLSIALIVSNYFSFLDFGAGRAITRFVAERHGSPQANELPVLIATALALVGVLSLLAVAVCLALMPAALAWAHRFPAELQPEIRNGVVIIALAMPIVLMTNACRGVLEGFAAFRALSCIQVPAGLALLAVPAASAAFTPRVDVAIAALAGSRLLVLAAHVLLCVRQVRLGTIKRKWVAPLLRFGGWLTVSTVVGPVIVFADRFVLGAQLAPSAVGYYAAPFEIASRLLLLPAALATALLPALAGAHAARGGVFESLRAGGARATFALTVPLCALGVLLAEPGLAWWLGEAFARESTRVLQILLVGFAFNGLAHLPLVALLAAGRARAVALLHLSECVFYFPLLYALVLHLGLPGAALAWSVRAVIDWAGLSLLARRARKETTA